jgi:hypothetical protein
MKYCSSERRGKGLMGRVHFARRLAARILHVSLNSTVYIPIIFQSPGGLGTRQRMVNFSRFVIRFSEWKSCPDVHPHEITSLEMAIKRFVFIIYKSDSNHFHCTHYQHRGKTSAHASTLPVIVLRT